MRALDVARSGYSVSLRAKQRPAFKATATKIQQLKNSSNNENTVKSTAFLLSDWKKYCLEKGIAKKIENYEPTSITFCSSDSTPELKTNMAKLRKRRFHFIESDSDTD